MRHHAPSWMLTAALVAAVAVMVGATPASAAASRKVALLVANHMGGDALPVLRYAERDAERLRDVLLELSGFTEDDVLMLVDEDADDVEDALEYLSAEIKSSKQRGDEVLLVFYYSGHAENGVLRMGDTSLPMSRIKTFLEKSGADVRLAFLDSCGAGAITREKGGRRAPPFLVTVDDTLRARGQVIIASSSADEASQESDDIQGSFFTHYLTSGLRGDADKNADGLVTLDEAYRHAFQKTVAATAMTRSGVQHPTYQYDLTGAGDVIIARTSKADVRLSFPEAMTGRFLVVDLERQIFVAEVEKEAGRETQVSLPVGRYAVKKRTDTHLLLVEVPAQTKGTFVVDEKKMEVIAFEDDYAKGSPLISADVDTRDDWGFSFSLGTGGQAVTDTSGFFPPVPLVTLESRITNVFSKHLMLSLDGGFGTRQNQIEIPEIGERYNLQHTMVQLGGSLLLNFTWWRLNFGVGPRTTAFLIVATNRGGEGFDTPDLPVMALGRLSPGLVGFVGYKVTDWFHVESALRVHYFPDADDRHLLYGELVLSAFVDL